MNTQTVTEILGMCRRCVAEAAAEGSVEALQEFTKCKEVLSDELVKLLEEAADMKWPFVPEKWQYKHSLTMKDKVNLKDLISENLSQLLAYLKAAILAGQPLWAASAIFLVDRFLYWTDDSRQLLRIARKLHQRYPGTPIAPQVVIRQARVYFSTGKLQKAEYILGNLISNSGSTGCWKYHTDSDRTLVQAVSVQVRGQVLQKLGLWFEAAELICASLVGFYSLPQPDKKGIGTSLGILANILVSMDDKDFHRFRTNEDTYMAFLGKIQHRLLSAAEAAKMAVIYSQYASLYVLTNVVAQGTCLLSYSFSAQCPPSEKTTYLALAKEAFEIGLLTKTEADVVTSKQELHTFVKAAYALAITHKWLGSHYELVVEATKVCREASKIYYAYCFEERADREELCGEIMGLVQKVKSLLGVEPYVNSDPGSFIPDAYRASEERTVNFTPDDFDRVMAKFQQHHKTVCEASKASCHEHVTAGSVTSSGVCITSFGTATEIANTECATDYQVDKEPQGGAESAASDELPSPFGEGKKFVDRKKGMNVSSSSLSSSIDSSWVNISRSSRSSNQSPDAQHGQIDTSSPTENDCDSLVLGSSAASMAKPRGENKEKNRGGAVNVCPPSQLTTHVKPGRDCNKGHRPPLSRQRTPKTIQSSIETEAEETDVQNSNIHAFKGVNKEKSPSSSLSSSFGSVSSWPKVPSLDSEMSNQRARKSKTDSSMKTSPKTISDQSSIDTEDENLPSQMSLNFRGAAHGTKEKSRSSSLSSSGGSLSSWQKVPSLPLGSSFDDSQVVLADNHIPANQVYTNCQNSSPKVYSPWPRAKEGNKNNVVPTSATNLKSVPDESMETEEEPDLMNVNHTSGGPRGASQGNRKVPLSSSFSSLGSSFSWIKVPSLDTESFNGDSGLTGRREGVPVSPNAGGPSAELYEDTKSPLSPVKRNKNGGPQKNSMDSAETGADIQQSTGDVTCKKCFPPHPAEMGVLKDILTRHDYSALLAGVCHGCMMDRLPKKKIPPVPENKAYGALLLMFSKSTGLWTGRETNIYIGKYLDEGKQRQAFQVQFLHQEELLGSYVGKQYYSFDVTIHDHLNDVERQMTAQYYVTEFNKRLYEKSLTAQIFFIPSEVLLILEEDAIIGCVTAEPFMLGNFSKLTNNKNKVVRKYKAFEYGIAFGHFTYEYSGGKEVVVDLQGWVTEDGKGLTYLTDPQIHTLWKPKSRTSNFHKRGIDLFLEEQHGPECNEVCELLCLGKLQMPKL